MFTGRNNIPLTFSVLMFSAGAIAGNALPTSAASLYQDREAFMTTLGEFIVDDFEQSAYLQGDIKDQAHQDLHSDASFNQVLNETQFTSTGFLDTNYILLRDDNHRYCAGCNGSFQMDFSSASLGESSGILAVGFDVAYVSQFLATVSFEDGTTQDYELSQGFWGIISEIPVHSIHLGGPNGAMIKNDAIAMIEIDNLTIGQPIEPTSENSDSASVPESSVVAGLMLVGMHLFGRSRPGDCPAR